MAIANLLIKIAADISELKTGSDEAVRHVKKTAEKIDSVGSTIRKSLTAVFVFNELKQFGTSLLKMGDDIVRTADRTGLLTDEVQKLSFIATQSGNSLEEVTSALGQMQNRLASGDKSALSGVKSLGLSFEELRRQNPYEQFTSIAEAIQKIPNPATRAQVAMDLFGRSGIAILPTLTSHFEELGNKAPVASEKVIRATEELGDGFDLLQIKIKVWALNSFSFLGEFMDGFTAQISIFMGTLSDVTAATLEMASKIPGAARVMPGLSENIRELREDAVWYRAAAEGAAAKTEELGSSVRKAIPPFDLAGDAVDKLSEAQKKAKAAAEAHAKAIGSLRDELSGRGAIKAAKDMLEALRGLVPVQTMSAEKQKRINAAMREARDAYRELGEVVPDSIQKIHLATLAMSLDAIPLTHAYGKALETAGFKILPLINNQERLAKIGGGMWPQMIHDVERFIKIKGTLIDTTEHWGVTVTAVSQAFDQLASITSGSLARVLSDIGAIATTLQAVSNIKTKSGGAGKGGILTPMFDEDADASEKWAAAISAGAAVTSGAMNVWAATAGNATKSANTLHGAVAGAKAGAAFGPYGAAVGAAAGAVIGLVRALDAGRDTVKDFAKSFGGFDALHTKLSTLGAEGERLWISLSQGVGKGNPTQAKAAIEAVTSAFATQEGKVRDTTAAVSDLITNSLGSGIAIPPALQNTIDRLITMGELTRENAADLLELSGVGVPSIANVTDAADRYGLKLSDLGPKIDQLQIGEKAKQIVDDWDLLATAGADVGTVMAGMTSKVQPLVDSALKFGRELPASMKPLLEKMSGAGLLMDITGGKLKDLTEITFVENPFDTLIAKLDILISKITDGLGGALNDLGKKTVTIPVKFDVDDLPGGGHAPGFAGGTHGRLLNFGSGRLVALHGNEGVFTEQDVARGLELGTGTDGAAPIVNVYIGDEQLNARMVKVARQDAARGGLKPRAAHGRSY